MIPLINGMIGGLLILWHVAVFAAESAGTTYPFLDLQVTPRAQGLGGAVSAWQAEAGSVLSNPASLAGALVNEVQVMQTQPIFDSNYYLITAILDSGWGLAWSQQTMTDISLTSTSSAVATSDVTSEGSSTYMANAVTLAKGFNLGDHWASGISLSGFYEDFSNVSYGQGYGVSMTLGFLWDKKIALVFKDLLNLSKWNSGGWERASPEARLGAMMGLTDWWDVAVEARRRFSGSAPFTGHAGAELRLLDFVALRAGYDDGVLTAGTGLLLGPVKLDAAYEAASNSTYAERVRVGAGLVF